MTKYVRNPTVRAVTTTASRMQTASMLTVTLFSCPMLADDKCNFYVPGW
jgi:hypothetical protein